MGAAQCVSSDSAGQGVGMERGGFVLQKRKGTLKTKGQWLRAEPHPLIGSSTHSPKHTSWGKGEMPVTSANRTHGWKSIFQNPSWVQAKTATGEGRGLFGAPRGRSGAKGSPSSIQHPPRDCDQQGAAESPKAVGGSLGRMLLASLGGSCPSFLLSVVHFPLFFLFFLIPCLLVFLGGSAVRVKARPLKTTCLVVTSWKTVSLEKPPLYKCGLTSGDLGSSETLSESLGRGHNPP